MADREPVGVVGVGTMGGAMARNLLDAGFEVVGFDVLADRRQDLVEAGGRAAGSPAEVAEAADVVILSLPGPEPLLQVVSGEGGLVEAARPGLVCVETSTLPLPVKEQARDAMAAAGVELLDCTISGTGGQAKVGDIVLYASGSEEAVERCRPVFEAFSRASPRVGDFGAGSMMKFISNLLVTIHTAAAGEALTLAARCGLDLEMVHRLLTQGAGNSRMLEVRGPLMVRGDYPDDSATVGILSKDADIILDFATHRDVPVPLLSTAAGFLTAARGQGRLRQDPAVVAAVMAQLAGVATEPYAPPPQG